MSANSTEEQKANLGQLDVLAKAFGRSITDAFSGGIVHGKNFSDMLKTVQQQFSRDFALKAALKPIENGLSTALSGLLGASASTVVARAR